jgi:exosortase K
MKPDAFTTILWTASAVLLGALKLWYPTASNADLMWALAPAAAIVSLLTGFSFGFSPELGFLADAAVISIDTGCSGINYFIVLAAFSLAVGLPRRGLKSRRLLVFAGLLCGSLAAAAAVNGVRIAASVSLHLSGVDVRLFGDVVKAHLYVNVFIFTFFLILCSFFLQTTKERTLSWAMKQRMV